MTFSEWSKKKKKEETEETTEAPSFTEWHNEKYNTYNRVIKEDEDDIAPVTTRSWVQKGAFEDGYQFGDVTKTILGTDEDLQTNFMAGILGIGEKALDAGTTLVGGVGALFGADDFAETAKELAAKDLYDEEKVAHKMLEYQPQNLIKKLLYKNEYEENSVLGERSDSLAQSAGQLAGTIGLQSVGVPWYLTSGVTSFGSEAENAFNQGASYGEAVASATIAAGAEILTEKLFGGSGLGEKGLISTSGLTRGISNKVVKLCADFGINMLTEGSEEVATEIFNNLGSALYKEENAWELLTNEEALDGYLESFIGGMALGGGANVSKVVNSAKTGRDYNSGLTTNEQKVVDAELQNRIDEAQKDGKELTKKEKAAIEEQVLNDLKKGYISTDVIESVLGGETYKSYQDTIANEDATIKELSEMYEGAELEAAIKDITDNSKRGELRDLLSKEVSDLAVKSKDNFLAESYNERTRRTQAFTADLSKYEGKTQETIKKAVESGILNDTNRTHEFVDMVAKISADKGVLFDFVNNAKLKETGFAVADSTVNGYVTSEGVTVNIDSTKALNSIVGHEITHVLEGTELYDTLQEAVFEYAKTKGEYMDRLKNTRNLYKDLDGYKGVDGFKAIKREVVSDLVGDYLFTDADFVNNLSTKHRNVFQKIYDEIKYLYKTATAGSKEARELEKAKRIFEEAYRGSTNAAADTKYSITPEQQEYFKDSVVRDESGNLKVMYHGTSKGGHTVFDTYGGNYGLFGQGSYFTDSKTVAEGYTKKGKGKAPQVYETYLNIKNPMDMDAQANAEEWRKAFPDATFPESGTNEDFYRAMEEYFEDEQYPKWDAADGAMEALRGMGYDGITHIGGGRVNADGERHQVYIAFDPEQIKNIDNLKPTENADIRYSLSDSEGKQLTKEQQNFFKKSKMRDENGNLKVMYHGTQDAGFHIFDPSMSDDETSLFFVDRNDVATSYSGTTETYEAATIRTVEDMNAFLEKIGYDHYEAVEQNGKFVLLENNEHVATKDTAKELYEEFCWYEGVGDGDANYKVYLNLTNPLEIDAKGRPWNKIDAEYSQEVYDKYQSLTAEEKAALHDLAEWEDFSLFNREIQTAKNNALASAYEKLGDYVNKYDLFSIASDNFSEKSMREYSLRYLKTRDFAQRAKEQGYDGVIFKNIHDNGGYSNGDEGASTVAIAFSSEQIKSVANEKPTSNPDIRYSLSKNGEAQKRYGSYNIYGEDVKLDGTAPTQNIAKQAENIAPTQDIVSENAVDNTVDNTVAEEAPEVAPESATPTADIAPSEPTLYELREEYGTLTKKLTEIANAEAFDKETFDKLYPKVKELEQKIKQMQADETERFSSLTDADVPPEMEAPYYDDSAEVTAADPFESRDIKDVGNRKVKAYMYENPEVKPFFQMEANAMLGELQRSTKGERMPVIGEDGYITEWTGVKRDTSSDIEYLLDECKYTYAEIEKGLKAIIEDNGAENNACSKRIEFLLNDRLLKGTTDFSTGEEIPPNQDYINLLNEKQITEYNEDSFKRFMESADNFAPIAETAAETAVSEENTPIKNTAPKEQYEAIRPPRDNEPSMKQAEPRMKRADSKNKVPYGKEERSFIETATGSDAVDGVITPDNVPDALRYYEVKSNKKSLEAANRIIEKNGFSEARKHFNNRMESEKITAEDMALGQRLIQEAAKAGDAQACLELLIDTSIIGTEYGQVIQAMSMIRRLSPEGQLRALTRMVERGKTRGDKSFDGVEVTEEMAKKILETYKEDGTFDQTKLDAAVEDVKQQIADKMKVTKLDKINAWRYLSMLGNPKTHARNIVSNAANFVTRIGKNAIARTVEDIAPVVAPKWSEKHLTRTKTWQRATDDVKAFAKQTTSEMESAIKGDNKYSEESSLKEKRKIFNTKAIEWYSKKNSAALEVEDAWFSKPTFEYAFGEYLTANGINTKDEIMFNPEIVEKAKSYALGEARRATFRQDSYLATKIGEIERKNPLYGVVIGSTMPFKKTPINVAKTGLAYSPLGIARNIYDAAKVHKGEMDASEAIDHIAQTVTGTSLMMVGAFLASLGMLNGAGSDDKEGKYDYQLGKQTYSFNFGGDSYSLSWLSPVAMPLFVGVNTYEQLVDGKEWDMNMVIDALGQTLDPLSEMSFVSSLDDVLSSYDNGFDKILGAGESMVQNYATQFIPTLSSQIASIADTKKRSTQASRDSGFTFGEETLRKMAYKVPGLRNLLEPTTDIWGNEVEQSENILVRALDSLISPANKREGIETVVDEEIKDLYRQTGDAGLIPSIPYSYFNYDGEKYEMSADEYTEFKQEYGQTAYSLLETLLDTDTYRAATSEERAEMVNKIYDYARDEARKSYLAGLGVDFTNATAEGEEYYKENAIVGALEADLPVDEYTFSVEYPEKYEFFKENGISYETYRDADEDGKRAYSWAYENPGKYTLSKAITDDFMEYYSYRSAMNDFDAKDANGNTVSGLKKERVSAYINGLDLDYGQKMILYRSMYDSKEDQKTYNKAIVEYLNSRDDISYEQGVTILKELGMTVRSDGTVTW